MYLSKICIKNYRSIKNLNVEFKKGKNVIVGRNNAGKSNIVKAIDLVLGEKSPTWGKSDIISENDFHKGNLDKKIFIWCQLHRNCNEAGELEDLDFLSSGDLAFVKILNEEYQDMEVGIDDDFSDDLIKKLFFFETELGQVKIDEGRFKKKWIGGKSYCKATLSEEFKSTKHIAFGFLAELKGKKIKKSLATFYSKDGVNWKIGSNASGLRNLFLQSAIIPAFRDTKDQLRISQWTWYGKLLKEYIDDDNELLQKAFQNVKDVSKNIFGSLQKKVCDKNASIAFPETKVSFQFNPDTKQDIYKSAQIYVDDGFNSELSDKGSGIQSTVTISLFDFYIREIAHTCGSLLVIEEPELYLHPHGRRVISDKLNQFLDKGKNQIIVTTHSTEFIVPVHEDLNIISVRKQNNGTVAKNIDFKTPKRKQVLIRKQHAEMFFADAVILTEDAKYILEEISKELSNISKNWLNENNVSILNTGGKTEFWKYVEVLEELGIPCIIIPDFDFLNDGLNQYFTRLSFEQTQVDKLNKLKSKIDLSSMKKIKNIANVDHENEVRQYIKELRANNIFILEGELEDYYLSNKKPKYSKEQGVLETISKMLESEESIKEYCDIKDFVYILESFIQKNNITQIKQEDEEVSEKTEDEFLDDLIF